MSFNHQNILEIVSIAVIWYLHWYAYNKIEIKLTLKLITDRVFFNPLLLENIYYSV